METLIFPLNAHFSRPIFPCPFCDKAFRKEDHLRRHVRAHLGARNLICESCGKSFSSWNLMDEHRKKECGGREGVGKGKPGCELCQLVRKKVTNFIYKLIKLLRFFIFF